MKHKTKPNKQEKLKKSTLSIIVLCTMLTLLLMTETVIYAQWDPRVPADNHPLAPAVGRLVDNNGDRGCTGWIAKGGILITAKHCKEGEFNATMIEFDVPLSSSSGSPNPANEKDQYTISSWVGFSDTDTGSNDWAIFKVHDNPITGLQPIEAQLVYIELKQDLSADTYLTIGYGIDFIPDGSQGNRNEYTQTLQMDSGDNLTQDPDSNLIVIGQSYNPTSSSGSPIIDESDLKAVGVATQYLGDIKRKTRGTSAYRDAFWNTYQSAQNSFTKHVTQKREGGQTLSGSIIGRWDFTNQEFDANTLTGSSISFNVWEGNAEVLRADQAVYNNPNEKYNRWEGITDVYNHRPIQMVPSGTPLTSQFKKAHPNITVTTSFPEYSSANGSGQIKFNDPWLIDYADPDFNDEVRNRGMDAEFYNHSAPFTPGFSSINGKLYNGLFLNENITFDEDLPNYSVRADESQTINFGGSLGSRPTVFLGWEGVDADFEAPDDNETGVVFTDAGAEARAKMKIPRVSNKASAFKPQQRNAVRTPNGWQHLVYESMGHIWYETKSSGGSWAFEKVLPSRVPLDDGGGSDPAIGVNHSSPAPWEDLTAVVWREGSTIRIHTFYYHTIDQEYHAGPYRSISTGQSSSFNTQPHAVFDDNNHLVVFYRTSSGLSYRIYGFNSSSGALDIITSGSLSGTSGAINMAVASFTIGTNNWFEIVYEKSMGSLGPPYYTGTEIRHTALHYLNGGSSATQIISPHVISSGSIVRNKEPSIVSIGSTTTIVGWISAETDNSTWDPWETRATIATLEWNPSLSITRNNLDHHVRSVSVSKLTDNSEFYAGWSQVYDQQGYIDHNKFAEGSALSQFKGLNTKGWDVQLTEAASDQDIHAFSYYPESQPYYWEQSNSLGSYLKQQPLRATQSRGLVLSDSAVTTGFYYEVGEIMAGESPVAFTRITPPEAGQRTNREQGGKQDLQDIQPLLSSEAFQMGDETGFTFTEQVSYGDSLAASKLLGNNGFITFKANLVDDKTGKVLATVREHTLRGQGKFSKKQKAWEVAPGAVKAEKVRIVLTAETNLKGLQAAVENRYTDDEARGKAAGKEFEKLSLESGENITEYALSQNYPNPFNPSTVISYQLPENGMVRLEVFDLLGRKVSTLVSERQSAGHYSVSFDASRLASGMYLYRLQAGAFTASKKLFLVK